MTADDLTLRKVSCQGDAAPDAPASLHASYAPRSESAAGVLAAIEFGAEGGPSVPAPLAIKVRLEPLTAPGLVEYWRAAGPVTTGRSGAIRFAHDGCSLFAVVELDEREFGGIRATSEHAYRLIREFQQTSPFPHLLRMWNFMDAVNEGHGDAERYRQFCIGRAHGLGEASGARYPAATAIGHQVTTHTLQVFWIAGRESGTAVENPRQISAYRYPRTHGPVSPTFSRATVTNDGTLFISGTASIVGHLSQHPGDSLAQLEETLRNLRAVIERAREQHEIAGDAPMLLKVYVRDPAHADAIESRLREARPDDRIVVLAADICRRELLLEIESVLQPTA
jgi:chorismate lyase/3-hydroxybenzoate synthase